MSTQLRPYLHTQSGKVALLTEDQASVFPNFLTPVEEGTADLEPGLFKPGTVEDFAVRENKSSKFQAADAIAADENDVPTRKNEKADN